jgi:hypothetical protein
MSDKPDYKPTFENLAMPEFRHYSEHGVFIKLEHYQALKAKADAADELANALQEAEKWMESPRYSPGCRAAYETISKALETYNKLKEK